MQQLHHRRRDNTESGLLPVKAAGHPSTVIAMQREQCSRQACRASFDSRAPKEQTVRYCNRSGPDGGHANRWTGTAWEAVVDAMEHDRG